MLSFNNLSSLHIFSCSCFSVYSGRFFVLPASAGVHVHGDFSSIVGPMHQKNSKTCKNHENRKIFVGKREHSASFQL